MSIFYYFISQKELPHSIIEKAHSIHYSINDITRYVKDARDNYYYYNCDPAAIYITSTKSINIRKILSFRYSQESNFLLWMAEEFKKLGDYSFIRLWDDNSIDGYYEAFFDKCKHEQMSFMDFCWCLASNEKGLQTDVLYLIK